MQELDAGCCIIYLLHVIRIIWKYIASTVCVGEQLKQMLFYNFYGDNLTCIMVISGGSKGGSAPGAHRPNGYQFFRFDIQIFMKQMLAPYEIGARPGSASGNASISIVAANPQVGIKL